MTQSKRTTSEDFQPDIGGLFDDFESPALSAYFGPNPEPKYQAKLIAGGKTPNSIGIILEMDSGGEKPITQWYSCGAVDQWNIVRNGQELVNIKDPNKHRFHQKSSAWSLVEQMMKVLGGGDLTKGQEVVAARGLYMTEAEFYTKDVFHWNQLPVSNPVSGEAATRLLPSAYVGEASAQPAPVAAPTATVPPPAAAQAPTPPVADTGALDVAITEIVAANSGQLDDKGLKQAVIKDARFNTEGAKDYTRNIITGTGIANLEAKELLTRDANGKFVHIP